MRPQPDNRSHQLRLNEGCIGHKHDPPFRAVPVEHNLECRFPAVDKKSPVIGKIISRRVYKPNPLDGCPMLAPARDRGPTWVEQTGRSPSYVLLLQLDNHGLERLIAQILFSVVQRRTPSNIPSFVVRSSYFSSLILSTEMLVRKKYGHPV